MDYNRNPIRAVLAAAIAALALSLGILAITSPDPNEEASLEAAASSEAVVTPIADRASPDAGEGWHDAQAIHVAHAYATAEAQRIAEEEAAAAAAAAERRQSSSRRQSGGSGGGGSRGGNEPGTVNGRPCGGNLPPCWVLQRESGGNPDAENPTSSASGQWQFIDGTWNGYGGCAHASDCPPEVQDEKAAELWDDGNGCSHWDACG